MDFIYTLYMLQVLELLESGTNYKYNRNDTATVWWRLKNHNALLNHHIFEQYSALNSILGERNGRH